MLFTVDNIKKAGDIFRKQIKFYKNILKNPDTPFISKLLLWVAVSYLLLPFDIIPDFIPIIGELDDILIILPLITIAMWFVPENVRKKASEEL